MILELNQRLRDRFVAAGWSPERRVDIAPFVKAWERKGYSPTVHAQDFMAQFGGIVVTRVTPDGCLAKDYDFTLTIMDIFDHQTVHEWFESICGLVFVVIGSRANDSLILMMDESGRVFGGHEDELYYYGDDLSVALDVMSSGAGRRIYGPLGDGSSGRG
jgi:hypothetical protein